MLKKSAAYNTIMECLSSHLYGMTKAECFESLDISQGTFSRAVDDLVKCGYVHESVDNYSKGHPLRLQLVDPFLLFHYKFLTNGISEKTRFENFKSDTGKYMNWRGHAFEILCMYHIDSIKNALGISGVQTNEYAWVSEKNEAKIDLCIERDDGIINLCEEKYTDTLNLARVLAFRREELVLSKNEGGEWALDNLPEEYHPLINEVLKEYAEGTKGNYDKECVIKYAEYILKEI